jgi:hypothetical protein
MNLKSSRRAIALVIVLWTSVILMMLVVSLYVSLRGETFFSQQSRDQVSALYVAEAGVAEACEFLGADPLWPGVTNKQVVGLDAAHMVVGKYSVRFHSGAGAYLPDESANNLNNALAAGPSYRGPSSVPANCALLVVEAQVGLVHRTVEVLVTKGISTPDGLALYGSDSIQLRGEVAVKGIVSLTNATSVSTVTHSDKTDGDSSVANRSVDWQQIYGTDKAVFGGNITTASPLTSVGPQLSSVWASMGGPITQTGSKSAPDINILGSIADKSGAPIFANNHSTSQTLGPGDHYVAGDLVINGDLILDKANLYVNGNVTVQGAISGGGSVYVAGKTQFRGDSEVLGGGSGTSVLSHDSIELVGFDGTQFLNDLAAANPGSVLNGHWTSIKSDLAKIAMVVNPVPTAIPAEFVQSASEAQAMGAASELGHSNIGAQYPDYPAGAGLGLDLLRHTAADLTAYPGATSAFLQKKLIRSAELFDYIQTDDITNIDTANSPGNILLNAIVGQKKTGLLAAAVHGNAALAGLDVNGTRGDLAVTALASQVGQTLDLAKIGKSSFQGLLYTHGAIYAGHEVDVLGTVVAKGLPGIPDLVTNGKTLKPGTVFADNGCQITYLQEEAKAFPTGSGVARVVLWCSR